MAFATGLLVGAIGVGGILLIPALRYLGGLGVHAASATALFSFVFLGLLGTVLYLRKGHISWRVSGPVCLGAVFTGFLGALASAHLSAAVLNVVIAAILAFAGLYTLRPARGRAPGPAACAGRTQFAVLLGVGAASGFGGGLAGVGGPVFSVPLMILLGFPPLAAIGTSQVLALVTATAGSLGNLRFGAIDYGLAAWVIPSELLGVALGARLARRAPVAWLRAAVGAFCVAIAGLMVLTGGA